MLTPSASLPVAVPQQVQNFGSAVQVAWLPLGDSLAGIVTLLDKSGATVGTQTSSPGLPSCTLDGPKRWSNPPYSVRIAATDGVGRGDPSQAVPVLQAGSGVSELTFDSHAIELTVEPPAEGTNWLHQPTLYTQGMPVNLPPFDGLTVQLPLEDALATISYEVQITDMQTVAVPPNHTCDTFAPPGPKIGVITQPGVVSGARYVSEGSYDVDTTGPSGPGPAVIGHRLRFGHDDPMWRRETDTLAAGGRIASEVPGAGPSWVEAAGLGWSNGTLVRGPFSPRFYLISQAPADVRLALTSTGRLRATWTALAPLPEPLQVIYTATLAFDGATRQSVRSDSLEAEFSVPLGNGVVPTATVLAASSAGSQGPPSDPATGPLKASGAVVQYDPLGRLLSVVVPQWGNWTYTYDDLGNVLTANSRPVKPT